MVYAKTLQGRRSVICCREDTRSVALQWHRSSPFRIKHQQIFEDQNEAWFTRTLVNPEEEMDRYPSEYEKKRVSGWSAKTSKSMQGFELQQDFA